MMDIQERDGLREVHLSIPLQDADLERLRLRDIVFLSGTIFTAREGAYEMLLERGIDPPIAIEALSNVTFHCSPAVRELPDQQYLITSATGTASFRFAKYMPGLIGPYGIKAVIGKTGMPLETYRDVFAPHHAVYLTTVGYGLGATYGRAIKRVVDVVWKEELGLAQAMWFIEVERFGPLVVESDTAGNSLFEDENRRVDEVLTGQYLKYQKAPVLKRLGEVTSPCHEMI
jgi:L(+)-tartrate dehydratase beta subunit